MVKKWSSLILLGSALSENGHRSNQMVQILAQNGQLSNGNLPEVLVDGRRFEVILWDPEWVLGEGLPLIESITH
jgi:hypothetical protein